MATMTTAASVSVDELCAALLAAEERLQVDLLHASFFGDGSGHVMAPMRDYGDGGERTDPTGEEVVFEFDALPELMAWLREGSLPEETA